MNWTPVFILTITLSLLITSVGTAEREISDSDFYFVIPESMTQNRPSTPEIPVVLGSPTGYPTFNIVVSSTRYDPRTVDIQQHSKRTLEEYRKIGLTDASISGIENAAIGEISLPIIKIHYSLLGSKYQATVAYVPAATKHFVLTYIDLEDAYSKNQALLHTIYRSFRVAENQRLPPLSTEDPPDTGSLVSILIGALIAGSVSYLALRRRG